MSKRTVPYSITGLRRATRLGDAASATLQRALSPSRNLGFPYRKPSVPKGVVVPQEPSKLGANFETAWARRGPAKAARKVITRGPLRLVVHGLARPEVYGIDRLEDLRLREEPPPLIFAPTHHSHLDTPLSIISIPEPWRSKLVVAAAADFFFDVRWKGIIAALSLNAIPIDREVTGRKTSDQLKRLIEDGWSLVIYPEGGRSPDGWGQEFKGGAAYLAARTGASVVPMFIDGSGAIYGKGMKRPRPGKTKVVFGSPMPPIEGESTRRFNARIEAAVTTLGDEALTDYWTARRRRATGTNPKLTGPDYNGWRRQWALAEHRKLGMAGVRRRQKRRWPDLG